MEYPNVGKLWTEDDDQFLVSLFTCGFSLDDICDKMGRNHGGVIARLQRHGLVVQIGREVYHRKNCWYTGA
jgi:hypothetical protein